MPSYGSGEPRVYAVVHTSPSLNAQRLKPERVQRFYRGGALIGRLRGEAEEDGSRPEEWIGSVTAAANPRRAEGLSRLADGPLLRDAISSNPAFWLGEAHLARYGPSTGLLVKLLDAAERLPVHAHPDRAFARARLGSEFGKTEAWIVLATREDEAEVWVGLAEPIEPPTYREWIGRQNTNALLGSLNRIAVRPGDVVYVPAGVPHAIGSGALIAEVQEPTDFSLLCEWRGFPVRPEDAHLGLGWETAFEALDLSRHQPALGLPLDARAFFGVDDLAEAAGRFAVLLVVAGEGTVDGEPARAGDAFALPAASERLDVEGDLRVLRFLAPEP
jgi:mannose-6-phosphate isomerase